jgi:xanthine dehydrogenase accessory factor
MSAIDIYKKICSEIENGRMGVLATIIKTRGSTPASELSKMVILDGGARIIGTIGGGCVEAQVITESKDISNGTRIKRSSYRLTEDDIEGGLICGGTVDILLEPLHEGMLPVFRDLINNCIDGKDSVLGTVTAGSESPEKFIFTEAGRHSGLVVPDDLDMNTIIDEVLQTGNTKFINHKDSEFIFEPVTGLFTVVLFGGGHVSKFVADSAQRAGFAVWVVDDRIKYASKKRFPNVEKVLCSDFKESFKKLSLNDKSCLVIITRGHSYDEVVLEQAVKTEAGYIGMIGSRRKITKSYNNLLEQGIAIGQLENVYAPLGLDIGAQSAEEIAVSIVAELIRFRRNHDTDPAPHFRDSMRRYFKKGKKALTDL